MEEKRLNFDDFKIKAEGVNANEILEKVQGGDWYDCHNCGSTGAKVADYIRDLPTWW